MNKIYAPIAALLVLFCCTLPITAQSSAEANPVSQIPVTSAQSPDIPVFQKIEDNWSMSISHRDQYGLELVISPLFVEISSIGEVSTRDQLIAHLINSEDKTLTLDSRVITVRLLGDVAVVNGTYTLKHKVNGNPAEERGVYTHVYQKVRAGWLCINSQQTQLRENGQNKGKKKTASGDELPFHVPLFSK